MRVKHGAQYFITFIDDFTRFGHAYLISHRSEALDCFKRYSTLVENQLNTKIKSLWSDRGHEYLSNLFKAYCAEKGIARQLTIPYMLQQNGMAERRNRTLLDMVRSMMTQAKLPISFWGDALMTAAYILNRVPSKSVPSRGANDASRVRVQLSSSRVVNISNRARARVELTRAELDSTR